jgi:hypothetical protein
MPTVEERKTYPTPLKKASFVSTPATRWVDSLVIRCGLIAIRLAFDVLLLLAKVDCLLTSIGFLKKNAGGHSNSGVK